MKADGTHQRRLISLGANFYPSWSPSGKQIVFASTPDGTEEIYKMKSDGSETNLANYPAGNDYYPAYSPNGKQIAFVSDRNGNYEISISFAF
jgi:TolB protein